MQYTIKESISSWLLENIPELKSDYKDAMDTYQNLLKQKDDYIQAKVSMGMNPIIAKNNYERTLKAALNRADAAKETLSKAASAVSSTTSAAADVAKSAPTKHAMSIDTVTKNQAGATKHVMNVDTVTKTSPAPSMQDVTKQDPSAFMSNLDKYAKVFGAVALAALIAYFSYKIYKNYLSKSARACKGSPNKEACMLQFKMKALQTTLGNLGKASGTCSKSKDPMACKAKIAKTIMKTKNKITNTQKQLSKLKK